MPRFPVLETIVKLMKGAAIIALIGGLIGLLAADDIVGRMLALFSAAFFAVILFAYAELIGVFLAIERNTFETQSALTRDMSRKAATPSWSTGPAAHTRSAGAMPSKPEARPPDPSPAVDRSSEPSPSTPQPAETAAKEREETPTQPTKAAPPSFPDWPE